MGPSVALWSLSVRGRTPVAVTVTMKHSRPLRMGAWEPLGVINWETVPARVAPWNYSLYRIRLAGLLINFHKE